MTTKYIQAINNLKNNSFSRDCYFYYVVPDEYQKDIAEHFKDVTWLNFINLQTIQERIAYQKIMCRQDESDTEEDESSSLTSSTSDVKMQDDDFEDDLDEWFGLAPWLFSTSHKRRGLIIIKQLRIILIVLLVAILVKLNLNHY